MMLLSLLRKKESNKFAKSFMCSNVGLFSIFGVFAGIQPAISGQTVPRFDKLSYFYIVSDF